MSINFEELDYRATPIGDLMLRRRRTPMYGDFDIYEVKLGEDYLMTNLFNEAEIQLAKLGLAELDRANLDVIVGGLGLGHTAVSALEDDRLSSLIVVEYLDAVIGWHKQELVPMGKLLNEDKRCRIVHADFFEMTRDIEKSYDPDAPTKKHDAILLDIDHTPTNVLNQTNTHFYTEAGLVELKQHLKKDGVFALWADGAPEESFTNHLRKVFNIAVSHAIKFPNAITDAHSVGAVYVAKDS